MIEAERWRLMGMEQKRREIKRRLASIGICPVGYAWCEKDPDSDAAADRMWFCLGNSDCHLGRCWVVLGKGKIIQGFVFHLILVVVAY